MEECRVSMFPGCSRGSWWAGRTFPSPQSTLSTQAGARMRPLTAAIGQPGPMPCMALEAYKNPHSSSTAWSGAHVQNNSRMGIANLPPGHTGGGYSNINACVGDGGVGACNKVQKHRLSPDPTSGAPPASLTGAESHGKHEKGW